MGKVVVFANNKGGVGKSTLSTNVAAAWAKEHSERRVLYVDLTFTHSISSILLGTTKERSFLSVIEDFKRSHAARQNILWSLAVWFVAMAVALRASGVSLGVAVAAAYLSYVYYAITGVLLKRVTPLSSAAKSSLLDNLYVLTGGDALAAAANSAFPWKIAKKEWKVDKSIDVIIDIDNALDDYARFAISIATDVVVPLTLNPHDFDRLCKDPRNGSLFEMCRGMGMESKVRHMVVNRLRCTSGERDVDTQLFGVSASDYDAAHVLLDRFSEQSCKDVKLRFVRELSPAVMHAMHTHKTPIALLSHSTCKVPENQLESSTGDMDAIVDSICEPNLLPLHNE